MCMCLYLCAQCASAGVCRGQSRQVLLELDLSQVVSCLTWVLGTHLCSSQSSIASHSAVSPGDLTLSLSSSHDLLKLSLSGPCTGWLCVSLTLARVIREEGASFENMPP